MSEAQPSPTVRPGHVYAGVVIRIPEPMGQELQDWRASFGGDGAGSAPAHITLMIADVHDDWERLVQNVRDVVAQWRPFHVQISGTGTFRPLTPVVYLRIRRGRERCIALHRALRAHSIESASPFEYHPHVTLAHGATDVALDRAQSMLRTYSAGFLVDRVHLDQWDAGGSWHPRLSIPFGAPVPDDRGAH